MKNPKLKEIYGAASRLFISQGYSKTKISHIANEIGVSVGTIYNNFEGKQEIMYFVLKCTVEPGYLEKNFEFPISYKEFIGIEEELIYALQSIGDNFAKNLNNEMYTFSEMISDAFDVVSTYAVGCLFIEHNQNEIQKLTDYYKIYRKNFFNTIEKYISNFIKNGTVRNIEYKQYAVTMIVEILCTWGMDVKYNLFEKLDIEPEIAKKVCMDNIINAYKV
nr:TetR/AcrR family transcriptional regulator [uncultured Blautia sp.]